MKKRLIVLSAFGKKDTVLRKSNKPLAIYIECDELDTLVEQTKMYHVSLSGDKTL